MFVGLRKNVVFWGSIVLACSLPFALAGSTAVIGQITRSSNASLDGIAIPSQGTLTDGDVISTAKGGSALVRLSPDTLVGVSEDTSVRFGGDPAHRWAKLSSGGVAARMLGSAPLVVETPKYKIEPAGTAKAVYMVALLTDHKTIVSARKGDLSVIEVATGKKHVVPEGHHATISEANPAPSGQAGAAGAPPGLLGTTPVLFAIGMGAGVAVGFGVGEGALGLGPASPSH